MKRPILYCAAALSIGIVSAYFFNVSPVLSAWASLLFVMLAALLFKKELLSHIFLYLAIILFGIAYYQNYNILPKAHISNFISEANGPVTIKGIVTEDPVIKKSSFGRENIGLVLESDLLIRGDDAYLVTGPVKVNIYSGDGRKNIKFGDEIIAKGTLSRPEGLKNPELFDYARYLKIKNIYAIFSVSNLDSVRVIRNAAAGKLQMAAASFRSMVIASIDKYLDERYSGFLNAILVGDKSSLDSSLTDDFIRTGTVHVIAISGLNTALIAGMLMALFKFFRIKKKMNIMITSAAIIFYCFVAGANPPVVRATVMFVIIAIGYLIDRESDMLNSLAIAAFAILLWNPKELFDPSFQLSFASIAGIVLFTPGIEAILPNSKNYFIKSIAVSLAAIISVAPIVARYFNIISPVALIANLVIVPALFVITVAAFVFLFFSFIGFSAPAACFAGALSFLTKTTFYLNHIFAMMPFSHIRLPAPPLPFIFAYYALMLLFFFSGRKKELVMALFLALNLYVWGHIFLPQEHKELKITFMDVGKGDSMLLEFPDGGTMLIDTGTGGIEGLADMGRSVVAPYLWNKNISSIDAVVSTHFHQDHVGGILYVLKNFRIGCVMDGGISGGPVTRLYDSYRREVSRSNLRRLVICDGDEILGFGDVKMFVINPREGHTGADPNESSVVIKLEYGSFTALLCGDVSGDAIGNMLKYGNFLKSDVLKVPHHGGSTGKRTVTDMFLKKVSPKVLVISSGAGFSSRKSLQPDNYDAPAIYGTKNNGAIEITTDGSNFTVRPFCKNN